MPTTARPQPALPVHVLDAAAEAVESAHVLVECLEPRLRRFVRALHDLGLLDTVDADWAHITADNDAFAFASLSPRAFDRLVCRLEDIAAAAPVPAPAPPGEGQLVFALDWD